MITIKEAYFIAKGHTDYPRLSRCFDLGDCWQFSFVPLDYDPENPQKFWEEMPVGRGEPTVDKETGRYWDYYPSMDKGALLLRDSVKIPVEELTRYDAEYNEKQGVA
jgi:hypothetical protein